MPTEKLLVNRAPVLTLWAAVVAERLGYSADAALTLGKSVAGLNAQAKGQRLGLFEKPKAAAESPARKKPAAAAADQVELMGRLIPVAGQGADLRATLKGEPIEAESVRRYLKSKFGDDLPAVRAALEALAAALPPARLGTAAYGLYEKFRPVIPQGTRGWGAKGELDLKLITALAKKQK